MLSAIIVSSISGLLMFVIGIAIVVALTWFILGKLGAPQWLYTALIIAGAVILLLIVCDVFFGGGTGVVRDGGGVRVN